jgi:uncharacterized membrane protein YbaN (DUF454 family)
LTGSISCSVARVASKPTLFRFEAGCVDWFIPFLPRAPFVRTPVILMSRSDPRATMQIQRPFKGTRRGNFTGGPFAPALSIAAISSSLSAEDE